MKQEIASRRRFSELLSSNKPADKDRYNEQAAASFKNMKNKFSDMKHTFEEKTQQQTDDDFLDTNPSMHTR